MVVMKNHPQVQRIFTMSNKMGSDQIQNFRLPNVTKVASKEVKENIRPAKIENNEFAQILNKNNEVKAEAPDLTLSGHASKRLQERQIDFNSDEYMKLREATQKLREKGGKDSLVVTDKAAYIIDVKNNKIVTAVDRNEMDANVFTKIDSTMFIN